MLKAILRRARLIAESGAGNVLLYAFLYVVVTVLLVDSKRSSIDVVPISADR
ncbi:MAG: hypothetical protein AAGA68_19280 [Pseudomonadota bacterium]